MKRINSHEKIELFDDTGQNDTFEVTTVIHEDDDLIVALATNEWYAGPLTVVIYKEDGLVQARELPYYYAKNV